HIVLVDNGRSRLAGNRNFRRSLSCIRCGACMNTCPVFRRTGGHSYGTTVPGPIGSILAPAADARQHYSLPFASSLCGSCTDVCPVKIDLHHQLLVWRREISRLGLLPWSKRFSLTLAGFVLQRTWLYNLSGKLARRVLRVLPDFLVYSRLNIWGRRRQLPVPPRKSFRELYDETDEQQ
ncbi:MAG: 4Fe-4S ferredoxin, partial [Planctomycetaceae bacterium]|nr:4Fe-4S ferredoxin [Planctomycetaceae bacterium]